MFVKGNHLVCACLETGPISLCLLSNDVRILVAVKASCMHNCRRSEKSEAMQVPGRIVHWKLNAFSVTVARRIRRCLYNIVSRVLPCYHVEVHFCCLRSLFM